MQTILVVEDDLSLSNIIYLNLQSLGFRVYVANSVQEALRILIIHQVHVIISDIMMYKLNGYDFIKILKLDSRFADIPLIFLTAKGMTYDRIKGYNLGCQAYLTKPFNPSELVSLINTIINNCHIDIMSDITLIQNNYNINLMKSNFFTGKEKKILFLVVQGYTNKEIAIKLKMNLRNVEKYISKLLYKSNSRNRTNLVQVILTSNSIL
uniref:TctD-like protein n=1 Tax=Crouania attenuata TaxID=42002 RepID=A0A4D6WRT9_9FLOR|nr:hypothetical protein [Crouania attenuata]